MRDYKQESSNAAEGGKMSLVKSGVGWGGRLPGILFSERREMDSRLGRSPVIHRGPGFRKSMGAEHLLLRTQIPPLHTLKCGAVLAF